MAKTLFSKSDLYHLADSIVEMHRKLDIVYKLAVSENNTEVMNAYSGIVWELELLINAYKLREMVKIN
jgi:hypothetical protein